jgi:formylglycine-generating enzyme required for sulfatase activity
VRSRRDLALKTFRLAIAFSVLLGAPASAVAIDWVTVGDPSNAADTTGFGAVADVYRISKYEVTNAEYAEFLNAVAATDPHGLYDTRMGLVRGGITRSGSSGSFSYSAIAGRENMPVNFVSFYDSLRFANWLHNGQGSGDTETGAYTITAAGVSTNSITRNAGASIFLPSEDEWYKAAYFDGTSYFDYTAGTNTQPGCAVPGATANTANCSAAVGDATAVGSYTGSASPSGTFDQGGNLWEWNEATVGIASRSMRGGSFSSPVGRLAASLRVGVSPTSGADNLGFRVASLPEPECADGLDNDGDGLLDFGVDPGCDATDDVSERGMGVCDNGLNDDGDVWADFPDDPGCGSAYGTGEDPQCQDGLDNDWDGRVDFDGGQSIHGLCIGGSCPPGVSDPDMDGVADPDARCVGKPWRDREASSRRCGLGFELGLVLPGLMWLRRRQRH